MEETWAEILDWPDYIISNLGRVYSVRNDIMLKPGRTSGKKNTYLQIILCKHGVKRSIYVHVLVAEAFVPGWFEGAEVNHKNGIKSDNNERNLEWETGSYNIRHAFSYGLKKPSGPWAIRRVRVIETSEIFENASDCAKYIGGQRSHVSACLRGTLPNHLGYTFEYVD